MITLYDHPLSGNCYKVRLALSYLGVPFESVHVDIFKGEHKSGEYREMNPNMKLPSISVGDFTMWESNAILFYLGKKFSPNDIYPENSEEFGRVAQWLLYGKTTIDPNLALARFMMRFVPEDQRDQSALSRLHEEGSKALSVLNDHLSENDFLAGKYSIADMGCYPYVMLSSEGGFDLSPYSSILSWFERIEQTPGYIGMDD